MSDIAIPSRNAHRRHRRVRRRLLGPLPQGSDLLPLSTSRARQHSHFGLLHKAIDLEATRLPIQHAFQPANGRSWLVPFWELESKYVGIALPFGFILFVVSPSEYDLCVWIRRVLTVCFFFQLFVCASPMLASVSTHRPDVLPRSRP